MMVRALLAGAALALVLGGAANASVNVSIWLNQATAAGNATIANQPGVAPDATTTVSGINFQCGGGSCYNVGNFLNNPSLPTAVANATLLNTYMLFTGSIFLNAGSNAFQIGHDDGVQLAISGISGFPVNAPTPTSFTITPFTVTAPSAGTYNFTLAYGECCGAPADLVWQFPNGQPVGGVPEPATWALMIMGFGGLGAALRRRRALPAAA